MWKLVEYKFVPQVTHNGKKNLKKIYVQNNYFCIHILFLSCKLDTVNNVSYIYR